RVRLSSPSYSRYKDTQDLLLHRNHTTHLHTLSLHDALPISAFKRDHLPVEYYATAVRWMAELNLAAARAMLKYDVHAATDITGLDRKSTRLNSSHGSISYAVFCLTKKIKK